MLRALSKKAIASKQNKDITAAFEVVSPKMASQYLQGNLDNQRHLGDKQVARYMRCMVAGEWLVNGESIKFDINGHLCDGQHRLAACVRGNRSFETLVVRNISPDVFDTIDTGRNRGGGDILKILGCRNHFAVASAMRTWLCISMQSDQQLYWNIKPIHMGIDNHMLKNVYLRNIHGEHNDWDIAGATSSNNYGRLSRLLGPSINTFFTYYFNKIDAEMAVNYLTALDTGLPYTISDDNKEYCPSILVKEKIIDLKLSRDIKKTRSRYFTHIKIAYVLIGWNAFIEGKMLRKLPSSVEGPLPEVKNDPTKTEG